MPVSWPPPRRSGESCTRVVASRVGLVGNPSDLAGGAVLAVPMPERVAKVRVDHQPTGSAGLVIRGPEAAEAWEDPVVFAASMAAGPQGPQRILIAAVAELMDHLGPRISRASTPAQLCSWRITWETTIPRGVGLAGSSALAVGVIDALARSWGDPLDARVIAALALRAEVEGLGIRAGWQDRIVQAVGAPVLVDAAGLDRIEGLWVPAVRSLANAAAPELIVGWVPEVAQDSSAYHGASAVPGPSAEAEARAFAPLAQTARDAARAWEAGDLAGLGAAMNIGWQLRQAVRPLREDHAALVDAVRATGAPATTPGSGGSVVALIGDPAIGDRVRDTLDARGARWCCWRPQTPGGGSGSRQ